EIVVAVPRDLCIPIDVDPMCACVGIVIVLLQPEEGVVARIVEDDLIAAKTAVHRREWADLWIHESEGLASIQGDGGEFVPGFKDDAPARCDARLIDGLDGSRRRTAPEVLIAKEGEVAGRSDRRTYPTGSRR